MTLNVMHNALLTRWFTCSVNAQSPRVWRITCSF